jgi:hypothetical protein
MPLIVRMSMLSTRDTTSVCGISSPGSSCRCSSTTVNSMASNVSRAAARASSDGKYSQ